MRTSLVETLIRIEMGVSVMKRWMVTVGCLAIGLGVLGAAACGDTSEQATVEPGGAGAGRIDGTVTDAAGRPVPGIRVGIVAGTAPFPEIAPETDAEGHFSIDNVPPGTFDVAPVLSGEHASHFVWCADDNSWWGVVIGSG